MQMGPGVEVSMRAKMVETEILVSNRMLRSAAATRQAKPGVISSLRTFTGTVLQNAGALLAAEKADPAIGECPTVVCAG